MPRLRWLWLVFFMVVVVRTAWITDDALISLRTILNASHGYGLTFNIAERVQTFTHPLWLVLLWVTDVMVGNVFYATFVLSMACAGALGFLLLWSADSPWPAAIVGGLLISSRAFIDYATSGLENPLTALVTLVTLTLATRPSPRLIWLWLGVSAAWLTRPDAVLLVLPAACLALVGHRPLARLRAVALGLAPALAWTIAALVYYGFALPNTAAAKLAAGIPVGERLAQGGLYLLDSVSRDPVTLVTIALAVPLAWAVRPLRTAGAGVVLYLGYVVWIGGDFMSGRFFSAPFAVAVWMIARMPARPSAEVGGLAAVLALAAAASPAWPWRSDVTFARAEPSASGIVDERGVYYPKWGLLRADRAAFVEPEWPEGLDRRRPEHVLETCGPLGADGLAWGPQTYLIDICALADPLLARLPAVWNDHWRPGHYRRMVPDGYADSVRSDTNVLRDRELAVFYEAIRTLTRSDALWSGDRLREIGRMARGRFDRHIDQTFYRHEGRLVPWSALADPKADGTPADSPDVRRLTGALAVQVPEGTVMRQLEVSLDSDDRYRLVFLSRTRLLGEVMVEPPAPARRTPGLLRRVLTVPAAAATGVVDTIVIVPIAGEDPKAIGHLTVWPR